MTGQNIARRSSPRSIVSERRRFYQKRCAGWTFIFPESSGFHAAAAHLRLALSGDRLEHSFAHSVWANDHIWRNRAAACGAKSCSADGGTVGHNKISVIIPCHRVVGANGSLTGYAGGEACGGAEIACVRRHAAIHLRLCMGNVPPRICAEMSLPRACLTPLLLPARMILPHLL